MVTLGILMSSLPWVARRPYLLLLAFCFLPVLIALNLGQDSILLLFLFSACYGQIRKEKQFTAGLLIALAAVKFQYPVMLFVLLVCSRKFRLIAGMVAGGVTLAVASALVAGRRGMVEYFAFVHDFNVHNGYGGLNPLVMVNARGFLAGLGFPEHADGYGLLIGIILLAGAGNLASRKRQEKLTQLEFAFFVTVALLASPYAHFPDMTILVLPAILTIDSAWKRKLHNPKLIAFCLAALFFVPYLLLSQGRHYWWESHVYLLFAIILMFGGCLAFEIIAVKKEQFAD